MFVGVGGEKYFAYFFRHGVVLARNCNKTERY